MAKDYRREVALETTMQQARSGEPVERVSYSLADFCNRTAADYPEHRHLLRRASSLLALPAEIIEAKDIETDLAVLGDEIGDLEFTKVAASVDRLEEVTTAFCTRCRGAIFGGAHREICECGREMSGWGERRHCRVCAVLNGKCTNCGADI